MQCDKCATTIPTQEGHEHNGQTLCEDCYIDSVSLLKTCDPWAVYTASRTAEKGVSLTAEQQRIINLLKARGRVTLEQICRELELGEAEFRASFSTLRHMELAGACKENEQVYFTLFGK